jgi:hypothetical protein
MVRSRNDLSVARCPAHCKSVRHTRATAGQMLGKCYEVPCRDYLRARNRYLLLELSTMTQVLNHIGKLDSKAAAVV